MRRDVKLVVFWGPPKTGKTTKAHQDYDTSAYWVPPSSHSWETLSKYNGQKVLVIDEFDGRISIEALLQWTSGEQLAYLCGTTLAAWDTVVIISNLSPEHWWDGKGDKPTPEQVDTLIRRSEIIDFSSHRHFWWKTDGNKVSWRQGFYD